MKSCRFFSSDGLCYHEMYPRKRDCLKCPFIMKGTTTSEKIEKPCTPEKPRTSIF